MVDAVGALHLGDHGLAGDEDCEGEAHQQAKACAWVKEYTTFLDCSRNPAPKIKVFSPSLMLVIVGFFGVKFGCKIYINTVRFSMKEANERRVTSATNAFALISGLLAFGHGIIIYILLELGKEEDKLDPRFGKHDLAFWVKVPFAAAVGIFALLQLFSSVSILILNAREHSTRSIYYSSIIGMLSAFAMGAYYAIQAVQYNANTREYPKADGPLPHIMPLYWSLQVGATALLLFVFPMMLFIFYHKLEDYIRLQRQERTEKTGEKDHLQRWCLLLFLIQALSNIGNSVNLYQYANALDNKNFATDNAVDVYADYFEAATVLCVAAIALQAKNLHRRFLTTKKTLLLAMLVGLFQVGILYIVTIKTGEFLVELFIMGDDMCEIVNCDAEAALRGEYIGYTVLGLLSVLVQIPYLKRVSESNEPDEQRDTLMTTEDAIES